MAFVRRTECLIWPNFDWWLAVIISPANTYVHKFKSILVYTHSCSMDMTLHSHLQQCIYFFRGICQVFGKETGVFSGSDKCMCSIAYTGLILHCCDSIPSFVFWILAWWGGGESQVLSLLLSLCCTIHLISGQARNILANNRDTELKTSWCYFIVAIIFLTPVSVNAVQTSVFFCFSDS